MPLFVQTELRPSSIHGLGLFACEPITQGQTVWEHDAIFDGWIHINLIQNPRFRVLRNHIEYLYPYDAEIESYIRAADNMNFANHSNEPNLLAPNKYLHIAARNIEMGEELTLDYRKICDLAANGLEF